MRLALVPQSLFGRRLAASVAAVLVAQAAALVLIAQEREHFVLQVSVREWTRRISETTQMLAPMSAAQRAHTVSDLSAPRDPPPRPPRPPHPPHFAPGAYYSGAHPLTRSFVRLPLLSDFAPALKQQLQAALGDAYKIEIGPTPEAPPPAIPVSLPFYEGHELGANPAAVQRYDVRVRFADGDAVTYRLARLPGGAPLPRNLFLNLTVLVLLLVVVLYLAARNITRPLSQLARAADSVGRELRPAQLEERGARGVRRAG